MSIFSFTPLGFGQAVEAMTLPNVVMTPGAVGLSDGAAVDASVVCRRGFARSVRHGYDSEWLHYRSALFAEYRIAHAQWPQFTVDHLVPIELDGRPFGVLPGPLGPAWDLRNVWPEPKAEARRKDAVEDALHRAVCARSGYHGLRMTLAQADAAIARDWTKTPVGLPPLRTAHYARQHAIKFSSIPGWARRASFAVCSASFRRNKSRIVGWFEIS